MNHKQKGIIVRLSDEEFHALNEKVEMSGHHDQYKHNIRSY